MPSKKIYLKMDYTDLTVKELKSLLAERKMKVSGVKSELIKRLQSTDAGPNDIYLLVLVIPLRVIEDQSGPHAYLKIISKTDLEHTRSGYGSTGLKIGLYSTADKAQEAAALLEDYLFKTDASWFELIILKFELDPRALPEVGWNGKTVREWSSKQYNAEQTQVAEHTGAYLIKDCHKRAYLVGDSFDYHDVRNSKFQEMAIYSNKSHAHDVVDQLFEVEPKDNYRVLELCVDNVPDVLLDRK